MKRDSSSTAARATLSALFLICAIALLCAMPFLTSRAQNPTSGTVGPGPGGPSASWDQTIVTPGGGVNTEAACVDGVNCEAYTLTVSGSVANWTGQKVQVRLTWTSNGNEYDIYIHKGATTGGTLVTSAHDGPGLTSQTAFIDPATDGVGTFTIHVVPDTTPVVTDHYHGIAGAVPLASVPPPPAPQDNGAKIGYENFTVPGVLVPVKTTSGGQQPNSVEYMGRNGGEPSVGSNWATGVANFQSDLQTLFITFNDNCPANGLSASWVNRAAPSSVVVDSDPIGFTDRGWTDALGAFHSRVFAAELTLLSPNTVKISHTDDDGVTWVGPDQPGGIHSAVDHETIGGGAYHAPIPGRPPGTIYPNAIYYCSQDIAAAFCARSDDGGTTYGASVPISSVANCGLLTNLHGHVKVTPDTTATQTSGQAGTVYVPNRDCNGVQSVIVSSDNGITWNVHPVQNGTTTAKPGTVGSGDDPAVGIDDNGRVYFSFSNDGTAAAVATSDDTGVTWSNIFDVGAVYGIKNAAFATAVGGSADRAAVAYYGSTTPQGGTNGDSNTTNFTGVWHLYVAHTFDGGLHWTTTDATPNAPMQRSGILRGGGADITRNLLDFFDITIDKDGRVLVGYVDGCEGGNCKQAAPAATGNAYTVTATIARQSSGRRLLVGKDPASSTSNPGMPSVTQVRIGPIVHLAWSEADTGNSTISGYQIWRGTASGTETLLTTVPGTQTGGTFDDITANDVTKTYYYKIFAVNAVGTSCGNNEIVAPYVGDGCTGVVIHKNDPTHPEANTGTATPPSLLIDYIAVGEPASSPGNFMFIMKVNDLASVPPNSRWRIMWNSAAAEDYPSVANDPVSGDPLFAQQFYVGMTTGPSGPPTFEYGTLADAGAPAVFVISETKQGDALTGSNYTPDGTITIFVPKTAFGPQKPAPTAPAVGSLLGAMGGRTFTGDTPGSPESKLERSNTFIDHTFVKAQSDNSYPAATYTVAGNIACPGTVNRPPVAVLKATPTSGDAPLQVAFDGSGSFDPDFGDTIAAYSFNFGDGSSATGGAPVAFHTYSSAGTYVATLTVTDSRGGLSQNTAEQIITVTPGNPSPTPTATPTGTPTATPSPTPSATPTNVQLVNIAGRVFTQSGDKVGIAGFIISGSGTKRIMARAIGPSLSVNGKLQDPYLEIHDSAGSEPLTNDNWRSTQEAEIQQTGLAPTDDRESAIVKRLPAGNYTAIIRGADNSPGIGVVQLYDLSTSDPGELGNLSVRASAENGDNVLFDGLILQGGTPKRILFRALGPSIKVNGTTVPGALQNPTLELHSGNGTLIGSNDDWHDAPNASDIQATGLAPGDDRESAILVTLAPDNYTTIVRGKNGTTGIGLAETYKLDN